jgi:hypothetical protein
MLTITNKDYIKILDYYKIEIPSSTKLLKEKATSILAGKLCRCIKKVDPINEAKSIGICTKTIFNNKGYQRGTFQCKKKQTVNFRKLIKKGTRKNGIRKKKY